MIFLLKGICNIWNSLYHSRNTQINFPYRASILTKVATLIILLSVIQSTDGMGSLFLLMSYIPTLLVVIQLLQTGASSSYPRRRNKPRERGVAIHNDDNSHRSRIGIRNMTCDFIEQPLNHFALPQKANATFFQRYCFYDGFVSSLNKNNATVLLYTGNESPLEQYINNTGLIFEMAPRLEALIVFVEHRYEGQSLPDPAIPNCMAYASSIQALADYANFIEHHLFLQGKENSTMSPQKRPVIAFGGSYGGMLAAWLRMKYPNTIAGAVAASAPIWGFPLNFPSKIDAAWRVVLQGLQQSYPPTEKKRENHCADNVLASWPLIQILAGSQDGRKLLTDSFRLCQKVKAHTGSEQLLQWAQSPWFDMAEGSFPYPSSYIPFALTHNENAKLPAWPLQSACWKNSSLHQDFGISFVGDRTNVRYQIVFNDLANDADVDPPFILVDWNTATTTRETLDRLLSSDMVATLLSSVRDAVSVWFNVTLDVPCYNLTVAPNTKATNSNSDNFEPHDMYLNTDIASSAQQNERNMMMARTSSFDKNSTYACAEKMKEGSWPAMCCNEEMYLIITEASGLGHDMLWPPSHPRGTKTYHDILSQRIHSNTTIRDPYCYDPDAVFGYSVETLDPYATWFDTYYGGTHIQSHSSILFSNGLLDPWSAAGVYASGMDPNLFPKKDSSQYSHEMGCSMPGLCVQNITESGSIVALVMDCGGHHTDLMYSSFYDPPSISEARLTIERYVRKWIEDFWILFS